MNRTNNDYFNLRSTIKSISGSFLFSVDQLDEKNQTGSCMKQVGVLKITLYSLTHLMQYIVL